MSSVSDKRLAGIDLANLDRDSGHWIRDDPQEIQRRRKLFWEIYAYGKFFCAMSTFYFLKFYLDSWIVSGR